MASRAHLFWVYLRVQISLERTKGTDLNTLSNSWAGGRLGKGAILWPRIGLRVQSSHDIFARRCFRHNALDARH